MKDLERRNTKLERLSTQHATEHADDLQKWKDLFMWGVSRGLHERKITALEPNECPLPLPSNVRRLADVWPRNNRYDAIMRKRDKEPSNRNPVPTHKPDSYVPPGGQPLISGAQLTGALADAADNLGRNTKEGPQVTPANVTFSMHTKALQKDAGRIGMPPPPPVKTDKKKGKNSPRKTRQTTLQKDSESRGSSKRSSPAEKRSDSFEPKSKTAKTVPSFYQGQIKLVEKWINATMRTGSLTTPAMRVYCFMPNHGRHPASNARGGNFSMWFTRYSHMFTKEAYDECHVMRSPVMRFDQLTPGKGSYVQDRLGHFYRFCNPTDLSFVPIEGWLHRPLRRPILQEDRSVRLANNSFVNRHYAALTQTPAVVIGRAWWYYLTLTPEYLRVVHCSRDDWEQESSLTFLMQDFVKTAVARFIRKGYMHDGHVPPLPERNDRTRVRKFRWDLLRIITNMAYVLPRRLVITTIRDLCTDIGCRLDQHIPVPGMVNAPSTLVVTKDGWYVWTDMEWQESDDVDICRKDPNYVPFRQDNWNPVLNSHPVPEKWNEEEYLADNGDLRPGAIEKMSRTIMNCVSPHCPELMYRAVVLPPVLQGASADSPAMMPAALKQYEVTNAELGIPRGMVTSWVLPKGDEKAIGPYEKLVPALLNQAFKPVSDDVVDLTAEPNEISDSPVHTTQSASKTVKRRKRQSTKQTKKAEKPDGQSVGKTGAPTPTKGPEGDNRNLFSIEEAKAEAKEEG